MRTSSLGWVRRPGAESCIGTHPLAEAVEALLRRAAFVSAAHAELCVDGLIERVERPLAWHAIVTVSNAKGDVLGSRELTSVEASCASINEPLTLAIALMIDPDALLAAGRPNDAPAPPASTSAPAPPLASTSPPAPAPPASSPPPRPLELTLRAGPALSVGLTPGADAGLVLLGSLRPPGFLPIVVSGAVWADRNASARAAKGGTFAIASGGLGLCPVGLSLGPVRSSFCAGAQLGIVRMSGFGFRASLDENRLLVNGALDVRSSLRVVGPVEVGLDLGAAVPFVRDQFFYLDVDGRRQDLFRMSPIVFVGDVTIGASFP